MSQKRILIFNGSPREKGTSYSFARTMKILAEDMGSQAEILHVIRYFDNHNNFKDLESRISQSDVICLIAPLYVDTLPYPDIWFFEKLYNEFEMEGKSFFAVGQCGFPDITRCEPLLETCRCFAEVTGMKWLGGLAYGGGARFNGALMEELGKSGKKITLAFRIALQNIINDETISPEAQQLMTIQIPKFLYRPLAAFLNHMSKKNARKHGVTDLTEKVYLK